MLALFCLCRDCGWARRGTGILFSQVFGRQSYPGILHMEVDFHPWLWSYVLISSILGDISSFRSITYGLYFHHTDSRCQGSEKVCFFFSSNDWCVLPYGNFGYIISLILVFRWSFLQSAETIRKQEFSDTLPRASVQDLGVILMGSGYEV